MRGREQQHDHHRSPAVATHEGGRLRTGLVVRGSLAREVCRRIDVHPEQLPRCNEAELAAAVGQQPVVADAMEAVGQHMQQEAAHELVSAEGHRLVARVPPGAVDAMWDYPSKTRLAKTGFP